MLSGTTFSQITKIMGTVRDSISKEPLPFVSIVLKGSAIGTTTDFNGKFSLEAKTKSDSIVITYVGYKRVAKAFAKNKFQTINIDLIPSTLTLNTIEIIAGDNPANILLRKVIDRKDINNREKFDSYQYEIYNKIQFDLNNIDEKFKNRRVLKPFQFVFNEMDTSTINGKAYLPIFLSEAISDFYYRKKPKAEREVIKATKVSGVDNESVQQFVGNMYININVYDNYIPVFQKNFISPIANFGPGFYKYYLVDSTFIGNQWCYKVMFKPRRKQELTFTGNMWIHDTTFAVKKIEMRMDEGANINFISDLVTSMEYGIVDGTNWMLTKENLVIDFNPLEGKNEGFFGHRTATYRNFILNKEMPDAFYNTPTNIIVEEGSFEKSEEYWNKNRHDSLNKNELAIYNMVDSVKNLPAFRTWVDIIQTMVTGYYVKGNFEYGPYASVLSFNDIEGARFRVGGRTSNDFSKKLMFTGYTAFGTKDQKLKYGAGFLYILDKNPRQSIGYNYKDDIEQLSQSSNAFREDFLFASVFRKSIADKLTMVKSHTGFYEKEWLSGYSNTLTLTHRELFPLMGLKYEIYSNGSKEVKNSITTSEIKLSSRFAYQEKFVMGEFERVSLGTKYPILQFDYTYGLNGIWNSDFEYHKLVLNFKDWFNVRSFGWSKYIIEAGKIYGTVPYPLLKLHEGNETYVFDEYAFNLMNFYEFASDQYVSFYYTHHFDGYFLNKFPLLRKLKWREVALVKGVVGSLRDENRNIMQFPTSLSGVAKPYFEAGVGVENILKIFRVDGLWRLSYLDHPNVTKFGIRVSMQFTF